MPNTIQFPHYPRPGSVMLVRDGKNTPLELAFEGVDHKGFGLWKISTLLRNTDEIAVTDIGFNYIRGEYESSKTQSLTSTRH